MPEAALWPPGQAPEPQEARAAPVGPPRPVAIDRGPKARRRDLVLALSLAAVALLLYVPGLDHPSIITFDENHYVNVARQYGDGVLLNESWGDRALPQNYEHPPLAKYAMWASVEIVGDRPVGWRLPSALVGAAGVAGAYVLGRRLFDDAAAGAAGAAALLVDNLYYLHTNMAMLEVFPASLTVWAFALALGPNGQARASALVYGAAVSCKYNAWFVAPVFFLVHWLRVPYANPYRRTWTAALWSLVVPVAVLVGTYIPYFIVWWRMFGASGMVTQWFMVQAAAVSWDFGADATHTYQSGPLAWVPMIRPVHYYAMDPSPDMTAHIYSVGNPVTWWPAAVLAVATLAVPVVWLRRRGWLLATAWFWLHAHRMAVSWDPRARFLLAGLLAWSAWVPYLLLQRLQFLYYMTSVVPYLAVLLGGAAAVAWRRGGAWRWGTYAYAGLAVVSFAFYFPLSEGLLVSRAWFDTMFASIPWMRR